MHLEMVRKRFDLVVFVLCKNDWQKFRCGWLV